MEAGKENDITGKLLQEQLRTDSFVVEKLWQGWTFCISVWSWLLRGSVHARRAVPSPSWPLAPSWGKSPLHLPTSSFLKDKQDHERGGEERICIANIYCSWTSWTKPWSSPWVTDMISRTLWVWWSSTMGKSIENTSIVQVSITLLSESSFILHAKVAFVSFFNIECFQERDNSAWKLLLFFFFFLTLRISSI